MKRSGTLSMALVLVICGCSSGEAGPSCTEPAQPGGHWEWVPPSPLDPRDLVATWTGEELLIWGEGALVDAPRGDPEPRRAAAYSPVTKSWRDITPYGSGQGGIWPGVAWTGSEWIVWGGEAGRVGGERQVVSTGVRIDPATGEWREMAPAPIEGRVSPEAVWTGQIVIFWQGSTADFTRAEGGAAYDPATDTWRLIGVEGYEDKGEVTARAIWSGARALFWNVPSDGDAIATQYDPTEDRWHPISLEGAPIPSAGVAWTGAEMLAWGYNGEGGYVSGGAYDPTTDSWRALSIAGAPVAGARIWAGDRMLTWGGDYFNDCRVGGVYDLASDTWSTFTSVGAPTHRYGHRLAWTGHSLLVIGGRGGHEGRYGQVDGGEFFPEP
jgi:hypothetical protein